MPSTTRLAVIGLLAASPALLAACGSSDDSAHGQTVTVALGEWSFTPSTDDIKAGEITFVAENEGSLTHELVLFKTDLEPSTLPVDEDGAVDERGAGLQLIDEVEDVEKGATKQFTVTLEPGKYVMACNVVEDGVQHFMKQMYKAFEVTEA